MTTASTWIDRLLPRSSIARRMMLGQMLLITALALAVAVVIYGAMRHSIVTLAKGELHSQAEAMASLVAGEAGTVADSVRALAGHAAEGGGHVSGESIEHELAGQAAWLPEIVLAGERGEVTVRMVRGRPDRQGGDLLREPVFLESARRPNQVVVSSPAWSERLERHVVTFGYRSTDAQGRFLAYAQAAAPVERFAAMLSHLDERGDAQLVIADAHGMVIHAPVTRDIGMALRDTDTSRELVTIDKDMPEFFDRARLLGQDGYVMYEQVPGVEWQVFVVKPLDAFYAPLHNLTSMLVFIAVFAVVLGGALAAVFGRAMSRPISLLTRATSEIAEKGRISERVSWQSADELGQLAASFNKMLDQLEQSYELLDESYRDTGNIIDSMADALLVTTMEGVIVRTNLAALEMLDRSRQELLGAELAEFIDFGSAAPWLKPSQDGQSCGRLPGMEAVMRGREGASIPAAISGARLCDARGEPRGLVFLAKDLGALRRSEERINYLASYDLLTGLPNRALFLDRVSQAITRLPWRDRHLAVMYLDLDRFRVFNDSLGHEAGDRLLKEVAARLQGTVRDGDTVARLGGDKYVIMLNDVAQKQDISGVAEKIIHVMAQPFRIDAEEFVATTSIGVSVYPQDGEDAQSLLKTAETAMHRAKEAGRNTYQLYADTMNPKAAETLRTENAIRRGLERGEFEAFFQPQVELDTGRIVGVEALVRWRHPEQGLIPPFRFLPVAEESGLIVAIGEQMLLQSCRQACEWQRQGLAPISVSVNIADRQFKHIDLPALVEKVLAETGLDPRLLDLELTEGILMDQVDKAIQTLERLRALGVKISIDDFGTGYSSLAYLKRFALDKLKIDRSFIMDIPKDEDDIAITSAILDMGRSLGLEVIAEGVENQEQIAFLLSRGCRVVQGFHYSPPVPGDKLAEMLRRGVLP